MNTNDPQFWQMVSSIVIAVSFIFMAIALFWIAITVKRVFKTVQNIEERVEPLIVKVTGSTRTRDIGTFQREI